MKISSISVSLMPSIPVRPDRAKVQPADTTDNIIKPQVPVSQEGSEEKTDAKGVLRLLAEGHFNPVADVRLRINFYEELAQQAKDNTSEQVTSLNEKLLADISGLMGSEPGADSQQFTDAVNTLGQALSSQQSTSTDTEAVQKALTDFMTAAKEILTPAPPADEIEPSQDQPVLSDQEQTPEVETAPEENPWSDALQQLTDTYLQNLSQLLSDSLDSMKIEPVENVPGKAYAKFLEIYESLGSSTNVPVTSDSVPLVLDTSA